VRSVIQDRPGGRLGFGQIDVMPIEGRATNRDKALVLRSDMAGAIHYCQLGKLGVD